ncbi:phosphoenolpyruvate synthase [Gracilibacillus suaedae]|uniref:phosphoenolpyruvate synthase n=1 Tax=Gracilibacillus suaedae TaxID=2820273 RepID=UPI001ABE38A3|nr:phosphoenolpyruvate synthase [Gracilibacillus suaedae]
MHAINFVKWFEDITKSDIAVVGGKGANLGELTANEVQVPPGFCVTASTYSYFMETNNLNERLKQIIHATDMENTTQLQENSQKIRDLISQTEINEEISKAIVDAYQQLGERVSVQRPYVAIRSSATAEDLPEASFAGQQDTYLEISGKESVLDKIKQCWASLWTARAIYYREVNHFDHFDVSLSAVVQKMVNSEKSGVLFTTNPINSNHDEIMINASWGLGEAVVSGLVTPDEYIVDKQTATVKESTIANKNWIVTKRENGIGTMEASIKDVLGEEYVTNTCLTVEELQELSKQAILIELLYHAPQDIEWALDADTKELYILQSRPITTLKEGTQHMEVNSTSKRHALVHGLAAAPGVEIGNVKIIKNIDEMHLIEEGDVLVTVMTNPDMMLALKKASAVITDEGGRTCHAAIVSRELAIPCIVGSGNATKQLETGMEVTVDATSGVVYEGAISSMIEKKEDSDQTVATAEFLQQLAPITGTKIYMNLGDPDSINRFKHLAFDGIGLMRSEFIFSNMIGTHPIHLIQTGQEEVFIEQLANGISQVAQQLYPKPMIVRLSDFRSNEFRGLEGGEEVEPVEANPMIGWRGVSRYISPEYEEGFRLECRAMKRVRDEYGLTNVWAMLPFVRTTWELEKVKMIMKSEGLEQNNQFKLYIMAEVPSVVLAVEEFAPLVDGFSIGSNDLTQLVMGSDRDSGVLNSMGYFDERSTPVKNAIKTLIDGAHKYGKPVSICGQGPSLYPEFTEFLIEAGIDSISVNPDTVTYTRRLVASVEQRLLLKKLQ